MQLGGIEREHTRSSHQVTNCMHEHTSYQKTGAAHAAASGMTEKLEQNRQEQLEMQASGKAVPEGAAAGKTNLGQQ